MVIDALLGLIGHFLTAFWVQFLPGFLLVGVLLPAVRGASRITFSLAAGFSVVPLALFLLGSSWGQLLSANYLWIGSSLLNITLTGWLLARRRGLPRPYAGLLPSGAELGGLSLGCTGAGLLLLFGFRNIDAGDVLTTIQHCLYVISLHGIQSDPSSSLNLFDAMTGQDIHFLIHHDPLRLQGLSQLLYEQRLGNVPLLSPHVALHGSLGWLTASIHAALLVLWASYSMARALSLQQITAVLSSCFTLLGAQLLAAYYLNENLFALAMVSFLLWAVLDQRHQSHCSSPAAMLLVGLVTGHLIGVRHTGALFLPGLALGAWWMQSAAARSKQTDSSERSGHKIPVALLLLLAGGLFGAAPWLWINEVMLGHPLSHPKVQAGSDGRVALQSFMGFEFWFKTLNWPVAERWVRSPWNPFPSSLWLPLLLLRTLGLLACAAICRGAMSLFKRGQRRNSAVIALFLLPHWLALSLLEGMDWEQVSYMVPSMAPLSVLLALGLERWLGCIPGPWRRRDQPPTARRRELLLAAALLSLLGLSQMGVSSLRWPIDERLLSSPQASHHPHRGAEAPMHALKNADQDPGVEAVRRYLTEPRLLPAWPHLRVDGAERALTELAHRSPALERTETGLPVYPSGQLAVLSAYYKGTVRSYDFALDGRRLRESSDPVRTAVWLHTVSLRLPTDRVRVRIDRQRDRYTIDIEEIGSRTNTERDFSFWLNPWDPPVRTIRMTRNGQPMEDLRVLTYGGELEEGERLHILTNYSGEIIDVVDVPYRIDSGEAVACGIWIFLEGVDSRYIETLSPGGAFDMRWDGSRSGTLRLPRNLHADQVVLFSDPYCGVHIPQRGDRYGIDRPPFSSTEPIEIQLNRSW